MVACKSHSPVIFRVWLGKLLVLEHPGRVLAPPVLKIVAPGVLLVETEMHPLVVKVVGNVDAVPDYRRAVTIRRLDLPGKTVGCRCKAPVRTHSDEILGVESHCLGDIVGVAEGYFLFCDDHFAGGARLILRITVLHFHADIVDRIDGHGVGIAMVAQGFEIRHVGIHIIVPMLTSAVMYIRVPVA